MILNVFLVSIHLFKNTLVQTMCKLAFLGRICVVVYPIVYIQINWIGIDMQSSLLPRMMTEVIGIESINKLQTNRYRTWFLNFYDFFFFLIGRKKGTSKLMTRWWSARSFWINFRNIKHLALAEAFSAPSPHLRQFFFSDQ